MKRLTPLLLLLMMYCSTFTPRQGVVEFVDEPRWVLWQAEEYNGYKVGYIRTFGELEVTAQIQNIGTGPAVNIKLLVDLCNNEEVLCCGKVWITPRLDAGDTYDFVVKYTFEYVNQVRVKEVNLDLEWK